MSPSSSIMGPPIPASSWRIWSARAKVAIVATRASHHEPVVVHHGAAHTRLLLAHLVCARFRQPLQLAERSLVALAREVHIVADLHEVPQALLVVRVLHVDT